MFHVRQLAVRFASKTLWATKKLIQRNTAAQTYLHKFVFNAVYPLSTVTGDKISCNLWVFTHKYDALEHMTFDGTT